MQIKNWPVKNCTKPLTRRAAGKSMNPLTPVEAFCGDALVPASAHLRNTFSRIDLFSALTRPSPFPSDASLNCPRPADRFGCGFHQQKYPTEQVLLVQRALSAHLLRPMENLSLLGTPDSFVSSGGPETTDCLSCFLSGRTSCLPRLPASASAID